MKKSFYIMGSIEIIVGAFILSLCSIVKNTLPILGRVAYQAAAAGSYSPMDYSVSFSHANFLGIALIILGLIQIIFSIIGNKK